MSLELLKYELVIFIIINNMEIGQTIAILIYIYTIYTL